MVGSIRRCRWSYYCDLFAAVRARYGDRMEFYALTIAEFMYLADHAKLDYATTARRFKDAGVRWITGGGSEILTEDFRRRHSKFKYTVAQYFEAQTAIVEAGLKTTATMVIGFDETIEERIEHLERTRRFQDESGWAGELSVLDVQAVLHAAGRPVGRDRDQYEPSICGTWR